jgi:hypothetical protein
MFDSKILLIFYAMAHWNRASGHIESKIILYRNFTELLVAAVGSGEMTRRRVARLAHGLLVSN